MTPDEKRLLDDLKVLTDRDPEIRLAVRAVCAAHDCAGPSELLERHPDVFDELLENCETLTAELGEYPT